MSLFIIEPPQDKYGNRLYTAAVVEVEPLGQDQWRVIAPESFRAKWPTLRRGGWKDVSGPARLLSEDEYEVLIKEPQQ